MSTFRLFDVQRVFYRLDPRSIEDASATHSPQPCSEAERQQCMRLRADETESLSRLAGSPRDDAADSGSVTNRDTEAPSNSSRLALSPVPSNRNVLGFKGVVGIKNPQSCLWRLSPLRTSTRVIPGSKQYCIGSHRLGESLLREDSKVDGRSFERISDTFFIETRTGNRWTAECFNRCRDLRDPLWQYPAGAAAAGRIGTRARAPQRLPAAH